MADLIVRNLEEAVVRSLREQAARVGISSEEFHRRLLRRSLLENSDGRRTTFKEYLVEMPGGGEDDFVVHRQDDVPRPVDL